MKKAVFKLELHDAKAAKKAMKTVSAVSGVESISMDMNGKILTVTGDFDPLDIVRKLRKFWYIELISVGPAKDLAMLDRNIRHRSIASSSNVNDNVISSFPQEEKNEVDNLATDLGRIQPAVQDTEQGLGEGTTSSCAEAENPMENMAGEMMHIDRSTTAEKLIANSHETRGEASQAPDIENGTGGESSFTSETTEWTLLMTNLLLEGMSAIFDQLGYALLGMGMAFVAFVLSTIDVFRMVRKEKIAWDGRSSSPSFRCRSTHYLTTRKFFGCIGEFSGFFGAVWQCFYSTMEYAYARQNKDNPIKMCLLPFIFVLGVIVSKKINQVHQVLPVRKINQAR